MVCRRPTQFALMPSPERDTSPLSSLSFFVLKGVSSFLSNLFLNSQIGTFVTQDDQCEEVVGSVVGSTLLSRDVAFVWATNGPGFKVCQEESPEENRSCPSPIVSGARVMPRLYVPSFQHPLRTVTWREVHQ